MITSAALAGVSNGSVRGSRMVIDVMANPPRDGRDHAPNACALQNRGLPRGKMPGRCREYNRTRNAMAYEAINFQEKLSLFDEQWQPKVIAEVNDYQFKVVKLEGDFVWHDHRETDEAFIVLEGELRIDFRDGAVNL